MNWNFLKAVLIAMNFDSKWINWIMECVTTIQYTLLMNGSLSKSFKPMKGLRQGNPLSPYLFLFCANILSIFLLKAESLNRIKRVKMGRNGSTFTHLFFAEICQPRCRGGLGIKKIQSTKSSLACKAILENHS